VKSRTRRLYAKLAYLLAERRLQERYCACRRPVEAFVTPAILAAMDELEEAMAGEPEETRFAWLETD
jgi:hypothetical protein